MNKYKSIFKESSNRLSNITVNLGSDVDVETFKQIAENLSLLEQDMANGDGEFYHKLTPLDDDHWTKRDMAMDKFLLESCANWSYEEGLKNRIFYDMFYSDFDSIKISDIEIYDGIVDIKFQIYFECKWKKYIGDNGEEDEYDDEQDRQFEKNWRFKSIKVTETYSANLMEPYTGSSNGTAFAWNQVDQLI